MSEKITIQMVQEQIRGLQRTQCEECWIRKDILYHILGAEAKNYVATSVQLTETLRKPKNLVQAMRRKKAPPITSREMVCIDRAPALEAMINAVARKAKAPV